ncbi:hypothetical protein L2750_04655 [Shewanella submarina]|uniref:Uncharacterized protein n=1 Tax=Shewanella submarina TaxID=2016376 RepID=A0ABV7GKR3_9GAMM|nr:hypothetical protein [Shewanella submarina]MCL1036441.1 hypothetical protein [Shewanella submarina]
MRNLILMIGVAWGSYHLYAQANKDVTERITDVANNPVPTYEYIELWGERAIEMCKLNARDYNINIKVCPEYISAKFDECRLELPAELPEMISSRKQGRKIISGYFDCISAYPHCNGREVTTLYEARKYCKES